MMMDDVTILMATYNGAKYLEDQLKSLFDQENVHINVLVRDDGSTDQTPEILNTWNRDSKLQWYTGEHLGVPKGYYDLMEKARNDNSSYYAFCDQDDRWDANKLEIAVRELKKFPENWPALYYSGQRLVNANMELIDDHNLNANRDLKSRYIITDIAGCTAVFNRCLLEKIMEYRPEYMLMHDSWIFRVCVAVGGNVKVDCFSHMDYRQHGKNVFGVGIGFFSRIRHGLYYITNVLIEAEVQEVKRGYYDQMVPEYRKLTDEVCRYQRSVKTKRKLLDTSYINFYNRGLNLVYFLKVILNRL